MGLEYTLEEITEIELATRGQHLNPNWFYMRKYLLTASKFKIICHSENWTKTSVSLLNVQSCESDDMDFGQRFEDQARQLFLKMQSYRHRHCSIETPGLMLNSNCPFLGASPDGILHCSHCQPSTALIEIKCFSRKKKFQPSTALVLNKICTRNDDASSCMIASHTYYYQVQGQMAIMGIHKYWLVGYTCKGQPVLVAFETDFWECKSSRMNDFYRDVFFSVVKGGEGLCRSFATPNPFSFEIKYV